MLGSIVAAGNQLWQSCHTSVVQYTEDCNSVYVSPRCTSGTVHSVSGVGDDLLWTGAQSRDGSRFLSVAVLRLRPTPWPKQLCESHSLKTCPRAQPLAVRPASRRTGSRR